MTQDELRTLPDVTRGFGTEEREIDGRKVLVPVHPGDHALFMGPDDGEFTDEFGHRWMVGWLDGRRVKRLSSTWS